MIRFLSRCLTLMLALGLTFQPLSVNAAGFLSSFPSISIPSRCGEVTDSFSPSTENSRRFPQVILIQDLHANPEVQRKIDRIIETLIAHDGVRQLLSEGGIGRGEVSVFKEQPRDVLEELVDRALLDGTELAAIKSTVSVKLHGLEEPVTYLQHLQSFRDNYILRSAALQALRYCRQRISSDERKTLNHLFLVEKLITLKLTREEWLQYSAERYLNPPCTKILSQAIQTGELFYRLALRRDGILFDNLLPFTSKSQPIIVVTGGFHTQGLTVRLKQRSISYAVITPTLTSLDSDRLYIRSLTEYLKPSQVSSAQYPSAGLLPSNLDSSYFFNRIRNANRLSMRPSSTVSPVTRYSQRVFIPRLGLWAGGASISFALYQTGHLSWKDFYTFLSGAALLLTGLQVNLSGHELRFHDDSTSFIPLPSTEAFSQKIGENMQTAQPYHRHDNGMERKAWVVSVDGKPQMAVRDNGAMYESYPLVPIKNDWDAQQHLQRLYNFLSMFKEKEGLDIQVRDAVINQNTSEKFKNTPDPDETNRLKEGIVDKIDIFRLLSRWRGTLSPLRPVYKKPNLPFPLKAAIQVDPKASNLEALMIRQWVGNPDIEVPVVVGMSPQQLFLTLHSSTYRYFLNRADFDFEGGEEGFIRIYGRRIRVVSAWNSISSTDWAAMGIHTVISTRNASKNADDIALHLHGNNPGSPEPIHLISMQPNLVSPTAKTLYARGLSDKSTEDQIRSGDFQLASSRMRIPALFMKIFYGQFPILKNNATVALTISHPQGNEVEILDKPAAVGGLTNPVEVDGKPVRTWMHQFDATAIPATQLETPLVEATQTPVGTKVNILIRAKVSELTRAFGPSFAGTRPTEENIKNFLTASFIEKKFAARGESSLFESVDHLKFAPTYTRGLRTVLIGTRFIEVSITGTGKNQTAAIRIPLTFDDQMQDVQHLEGLLYEIGKRELRNLARTPVAADHHHSEWQRQQDLAMARGSIPRAAPEVPVFIDLAPQPLRLGVMSAGRSTSLSIRDLPNTLNVRLVAISGEPPENIMTALETDSAYGLWGSNGQRFDFSIRNYKPLRRGGDLIGSIKINGGHTIQILRRFSDTSQINWKQAHVDVVLEGTGNFTDPTKPNNLLGHTSAGRGTETGAKMAVLSAPYGVGEGHDFPTIVLGLNHHGLIPYIQKQVAGGEPIIISNASCTTHGTAFLVDGAERLFKADFLGEIFSQWGVHNATLVSRLTNYHLGSTHAATNTNQLADGMRTRNGKDHTRMRTGRGLIPTQTGVSKALGPLGEKMAAAVRVSDATAVRTPNPTGSLLETDFTYEITGLGSEQVNALLKDKKGAESAFKREIREIFNTMSHEPELLGAVQTREADEATTSEQVVGSRAAVVFDNQDIKVRLDRVASGGLRVYLRIQGWYDNELGYSSRTTQLIDYLARIYPQTNDEEHDFAIPSLFDLFHNIQFGLFGNRKWGLVFSAGIATFVYLPILPRLIILNVYGLNRWRLKTKIAWKAISKGYLFGHHDGDGGFTFTSGVNPMTRAFDYLWRHEKAPSETKGLIAPLMHRPFYALAGLVSAPFVYIANRASKLVGQQHLADRSLLFRAV